MKVISPDSIVDIKISGAFYARLTQLALHLAQDKTAEDIQKAAKLLSEGKFEDVWSYHYGTLLVLLSTVEREALNQNKVEEKDLTSQPES